MSFLNEVNLSSDSFYWFVKVLTRCSTHNLLTASMQIKMTNLFNAYLFWAVFVWILFWIVVIFFSSRFNWSLKVWIFSCRYFCINSILVWSDVMFLLISSCPFFKIWIFFSISPCRSLKILTPHGESCASPRQTPYLRDTERYRARNFSVCSNDDDDDANDCRLRHFSIQITQIYW